MASLLVLAPSASAIPASVWRSVAHPDIRAAGGAPRAATSPALWCGARLAGDDTAHQVDNGAYRYHAIYAVPRDRPVRLTHFAAQLQSDASQASGLLERLYGRAIRFDLGTSCGPQYLDISVVRLRETAAQLRRSALDINRFFDLMAGDLRPSGFDVLGATTTVEHAAAAKVNFAVWVDGVEPANICGLGQGFSETGRDQDNINNDGGKLAIVFRSGSGFCDANTLRHEIGHNLGALQTIAPHAFDGMHCNDAYEDTMCYPTAPERSDGNFQSQYFDYGNDDYWDPPHGRPLGFWTVDLSRFICADTTCDAVPSGLAGGLASLLKAVGRLPAGMLVSCPVGRLLAGSLCVRPPAKSKVKRRRKRSGG